MRKLMRYLEFFLIPIVLLAVAIFCWFYVPESISSFRAGLLGTALGVGISLFAAESFKKITEYKRIKKTFGLLKLVTIPYLKNQAENFSATMQIYHDMCSIDQALSFLAMSSHFNRVSDSFDKSWLQMVYSQDFIDAIGSDQHLNKIANAILEVLLFIKQIAAQSVNAQTLLLNDVNTFSDTQKTEFLNRAKKIRDDLEQNAQKLQKYTDKLDEEVLNFLIKNGTIYSEIER
ncbi:MAG: hypothetical protein NT098_03465 [Candidatus Parcubacteria bacterium]|nr:hypothetical protein [Candidatus Parcubacteria bacterium]